MPESDRKILVVDDIRDNVKILGQILRPYFKVVFATTGPDAVKMAFSDEPPVLVLLDILMPQMDGYKVCEALKKNPKTSDIPVIFVTGATDDATLKKAFETGAADYVRKPVNRIELLARIKSVLTQKRLVEKIIGEEKLKTVIETAGGVCHEMNQPMQTISSYAELLLMKLPESHPCSKYSLVIKEQIEKMGDITKRLAGITEYATAPYPGGTRIIDIAKASKPKRKSQDDKPLPGKAGQ